MVPEGDQHTYKVLFFGIVDNSAEGRRAFLRRISKRFRIPAERFDYLTNKTPVLLKRGLSFAKAHAVAKEFEALGGKVQSIREGENPSLEVEFNGDKTPFLQVESLTSSFRGGRIEVSGRVKNITSHPLKSLKVIAQFFGPHDKFIMYEESPVAFGILHPDQCSPFRVTADGNADIGRISITFKGDDGAMIVAEVHESPSPMGPPSRKRNRSQATTEVVLGKDAFNSKTFRSLLEQVVSRISKDEFTQADVEEVLRGFFPEKWTLLERRYPGVDGLSARQYLAEILSRHAQTQGSSIHEAGTFVEGPPGWGVRKMAVYKRDGLTPSAPSRVPLTEFDGQSPLRNFACLRISQNGSSSIARALIKGYNEEKIPHDVRNFNHLGFNAKSLVGEEDVLLRFLALVLFDKWPFRPWEMVWDEEGGSVHSLLRKEGLFDTREIRRASLDEIESKLRACVIKGTLRLHTDGGRTRFARTLKELSLHVDGIASSMRSASNGSDIVLLHQDIMKVQGFSALISARSIAYAMRELGAGRTSPPMFEPIARYLRKEWRISDWGERLELPVFGGRPNLFNEILDQLSDDPLAFDYLCLLGTDYCQDRNCEHCSLG